MASDAPRFIVRPAAEADIEEAALWYELRSLGLGADFLLDPDTGFYSRHGSDSTKTVLVAEVAEMLVPRRTLIDGLRMLRDAGLSAFAYQSQSASLFFAARKLEDLTLFETGLRNALAGVSKEIVDRRLVA